MTQTSDESSLRDFVANVGLIRVVTYELRAARRDSALGSLRLEPDQDVPEPELSVQYQVGTDLESFGVRFRTEAANAQVEGIADVGLFYAYTAGRMSDVDDATVNEFIERVAIMTAFPFVRQGLFTVTAQSGPPILLDMLHAGSFAYNPDETDIEVSID